MKKTRLYFLILFLITCFSSSSFSTTINLSLTGDWTPNNFSVTGMTDALYDSTNPRYDGKVFGVSPSAGSVTVDLLVNAVSPIYYDGPITDYYGYTDVTLQSSTFSFGTATWDSTGILENQQMPGGLTASLWTDIDLNIGTPTDVYFRMFGEGDGITADILFNPSQFLLWEFYLGEEIRSSTYSAAVVPEPSTFILLFGGLAGLAFIARRRKQE